MKWPCPSIKPGIANLSGEVDDFGLRADVRLNAVVGSDGSDRISAKSDGLGRGSGRIDRCDFPVPQHESCRFKSRRYRAACLQGRGREGEKKNKS
jgi:hypothetical protein